MNSHICGLTRLLGLIHKHKMDSLEKRGQGATASNFVEKGAESNGLISDIKVSGLVMVPPKQARKLTTDLLGASASRDCTFRKNSCKGKLGSATNNALRPSIRVSRMRAALAQ